MSDDADGARMVWAHAWVTTRLGEDIRNVCTTDALSHGS